MVNCFKQELRKEIKSENSILRFAFVLHRWHCNKLQIIPPPYEIPEQIISLSKKICEEESSIPFDRIGLTLITVANNFNYSFKILKKLFLLITLPQDEDVIEFLKSSRWQLESLLYEDWGGNELTLEEMAFSCSSIEEVKKMLI